MSTALAKPCRGGWFLPSVFTLELRKIFAYRVDFWIQFLGSLLVQFAVAWFLWKSIFAYRGIDRIGEFTFRSLMLYYLLVPVIGRAIRGNQMGGIAQEIYQGTLTKYLIYPVSYFGYQLTAHLAHTLVFLFQAGVAVAGFLFFFNDGSLMQISPTHVCLALTAGITATVLHFIMISLIQLTAFWADNVWSLVVIVRFITGLLGGGMIPLSLFPAQIQPFLAHLPFAFFMNFPIRCFTGRVGWREWAAALLIMFAWIVIFSLLYALVWRRGKYRYTGVGI